VIYTGIEASDVIQMTGGYGILAGKDPEKVATGSVQVGDLGCEGVGKVIKLGSSIYHLKEGQFVCFWGFGVSFREYVTIEAKDQCVPIPKPLPDYVALPISGLTAVCGLELAGHLKRGENVLVTAAAGGTGHIAVQWAKLKGCKVAGTCRSESKEKLLKEIGCDVVINYKKHNLETILKREFPNGIDVVYEAVGGEFRKIAFNNLAIFGRLILIGNISDDYTKLQLGSSKSTHSTGSLSEFSADLLFAKCLTVSGFYCGMAYTHERFGELTYSLFSKVAEGKIKVKLDSSCEKWNGLADLVKAQQYIRSGDSTGKVYLKIQN